MIVLIILLIIFGAWFIPAFINLTILFILYKRKEKRKVTLEEFWNDQDDLVHVISAIPIFNVAGLIALIALLIWYPIWNKIKDIKI